MDAYTKMQQLVNTRVKGGFNAVESAALLTTLVKNHKGDNLALALLYEGFVRTPAAAERAAYLIAA